MSAPTWARRDQVSAGAEAEDRERGSAVAEFAMVIALLMLLFLALLQVCLWAYTRTLVSAAAADAARYAALSGTVDVTQRVSDRLGDGIGTGMKSTLSCTSAAGSTLVEVRCTMDAPGLVGLLDGVMPMLDVTSHAALEPTS